MWAFQFCKSKQTLTGVSEAQSPETQVGGCVRDAAQTELYGVNCLMQENIPKIKLQGNIVTFR